MEGTWLAMDAELEELVAQAPDMVEADSRTSTPVMAPCRVELPKRFQSIRISGGKALKRKLVPATTGMGLFKEFQSWDDPLKPLGNAHLLIMMKHLEQQLSVPIISGVMADTWTNTTVQALHGVKHAVYQHCFKLEDDLARSRVAREEMRQEVARKDALILSLQGEILPAAPANSPTNFDGFGPAFIDEHQLDQQMWDDVERLLAEPDFPTTDYRSD